MTWTNPPIDGQKPVSDNKTPLNNAHQYIENTFKVDHYFNEANSNFDGHHKVIQMDNQALDPSIGNDMDNMIFSKSITTNGVAKAVLMNTYVNHTESTGETTVTHTAQVGRVLASVFFTLSGSSINADWSSNNFNVSSVTRISSGTYDISFTNDLPHDKYVIVGSAMGTASQTKGFRLIPAPASVYSSTFTVSKIRIQTVSGSTVQDPLAVNMAILEI